MTSAVNTKKCIKNNSFVLPKGENVGVAKMITNIKTVPRNLWILIFLCHLIPFSFEMYASDDIIIEMQISILWFLCLIPSMIITYYLSNIGGILAAFFAMITHINAEILIKRADKAMYQAKNKEKALTAFTGMDGDNS